MFDVRTGARRAAFLVGGADDRGGARRVARDPDDGRPELVARVAVADRLAGDNRTSRFPADPAGGTFGG